MARTVSAGKGAGQGTARRSPAQLTRFSYTSAVDNLERDCLVYVPVGHSPDSSRTWPLLMFLHGDGERGDGKADLDLLLRQGPLSEAWIQKRDLPFVIVAPQLQVFGRGKSGSDYIARHTRADTPPSAENGSPPHDPGTPSPAAMPDVVSDDLFPRLFGPDSIVPGWDRAEQDLLAILDKGLADYRGDPSRVYLTGLSLGGIGTWYMASRHPDRFAAILPVVGFGLPGMMEPIARAKIPVWVFSGGLDPLVPTSYFFPAVNRLKELGHAEVRFTTEQDMAHDVWSRVYARADVYEWLRAHRR